MFSIQYLPRIFSMNRLSLKKLFMETLYRSGTELWNSWALGQWMMGPLVEQEPRIGYPLSRAQGTLSR